MVVYKRKMFIINKKCYKRVKCTFFIIFISKHTETEYKITNMMNACAYILKHII